MNTILESILNGLMGRYRERVPDVQAIINCMVDQGLIQSGDEIENDHIAFRTMGVQHLGIQSLEKIFLHHGYKKCDAYFFAKKKLNAFWYAPPSEKYPRIFISELLVDQLSNAAQQVIRKYTDEVERDPVDSLDCDNAQQVDEFLHAPLWRTPTWDDFEFLSRESEYAAWVIYNRYYLNHFTISVHNLPEPFDTITRFNDFLESSDFRLNDSGGKYKTSSDGLLVQSSTVAKMIEANFDDGRGGNVAKMIAGSYVEFAERKIRPEFAAVPRDRINRSHRREGFEAANADKIFESTYNQQTSKNHDSEIDSRKT